jgi:small subunit ribosomal protein S20
MSSNPSVQKRIRQADKANERNKHNKSKMRTAINKVLKSTSKEESSVLLKDAISIIDKVVTKGVVHKNNAANQKARITNHVNNL